MLSPDKLGSMWLHFVNLLSQSCDLFLAAIGTTGLGWWVQAIILFLVTEIGTYLVVWRVRGKDAMKTRAAENLRIGFYVWLLALAFVYIPIFGWNVIKATYIDHERLVSSNSALRDANKALLNSNSQLEADKKRLEDENEKLNSHSLSSQPTSKVAQGNPSSVPQQLPPPVQDMRIVSQEWIPSVRPQFKYELKVVVQTNVTIQPVSIVFACDHNISEGYVIFAGDSGIVTEMDRTGVLIKHRNAFLVSFERPAFTAEKNMLVMLFSNDPIKVTQFDQIPFRAEN